MATCFWDPRLREELGLRGKAPNWLELPAMMRIVVNTPHVLDRLNHSTQPYNFLFCPLMDPVAGYPANVDPEHFRPMTAFTRKRERWAKLECVNAHDGKVYRLGLRQTARLDKVIPQTFGYILRLYLRHPESKSLGPDGTQRVADTRGLLKRASVVAGEPHSMGKETDRRWEQGEDVSLLEFTPMESRPSGMVVADTALREKAGKRGMRELMRKTGLSQHTIEKFLAGRRVREATLKRLRAALGQEHERFPSAMT